MAVSPWFDYNAYMTNKVAQLKNTEPAANWTYDKVAQAFADLGYAGIEGAERHFVDFGQNEDVAPNAFFNPTEYYRAKAAQAYGKDYKAVTDADAALVKAAIKGLGMNAWSHYDTFGSSEKVNPSNQFDTEAYMKAKLDALNAIDGGQKYELADVYAAFKAAGINALEHFMTFGGNKQPGEVAQKYEGTIPAEFAVPENKKVAVGGVSEGETYTLTQGIDNFMGTAGNDTFIGDANTASPADQVKGGAGIDTLKLYGNAAKPVFSGVEKVYLNGNTAGFDISANADVTSLELDNVATAQTYTIANGQAVSVSNMDAGETVDFAGNSVTALVMELNGVAATGADATIDLNSTAQTSLDIKTSGAKSQVTLTNTGAKLDTINIAAKVALELGHALTTVTTINAAASTAGVDIDAVGTSNLTFIGGSGDDRIAMAGTLTGADKLDGGAGTDILSVSDADTIDSAAEVANIKNFEIFEAAAADSTAYDLTFLNANNALSGLIIAGAATVTVNNMNAATTGNIKIVADTTAVLTAKDFIAGGVSDTATITLDNSVAPAADGIDVTNLTFNNLDVLNLISKSDGSPTKTVGGTKENSIKITATDLDKIVVTGDEAVLVETAAGTLPAEIDASGMTDAAVSIDTDASAIVSILVKGTSKNDTIDIDNAATLNSTLYLGGGSDTVTVVGGGSGAHTLKFTADALNSGDIKAGNVSTVTLTSVTAGDKVALEFTDALQGLLKSNGTVLGNSNANINIHGTALSNTTNIAAAQNGGNMVLQIDLNGDGRYNAADDYQITLIGTGTDDTLVYDASTGVLTFTVA